MMIPQRREAPAALRVRPFNGEPVEHPLEEPQTRQMDVGVSHGDRETLDGDDEDVSLRLADVVLDQAGADRLAWQSFPDLDDRT